MILNIGPDARGNFPETAVEELRKVGAWLSKNGCSIYNCGHSEIEKPEWGRYTEPLEMREDKQFRTVLRMFSNRPSVRCRFSGYGLMRLSRCGLRQRAASFAAGRHGIRCCIAKHRL